MVLPRFWQFDECVRVTRPLDESQRCRQLHAHIKGGVNIGMGEMMRVITGEGLDRLRTLLQRFCRKLMSGPMFQNFQHIPKKTSHLFSFPYLPPAYFCIYRCSPELTNHMEITVSKDQAPNLITYNSLLHGLASARRWSMAVMMLTALE